MKMIYVIAEGRTECNFVKSALAGHFHQYNVSLIPITIPTGKSPSGGTAKGGWRRTDGYAYALRNIQRIIKTNNYAAHTTFFDYYAFPIDIPCREEAALMDNPLDKAALYEKQLYEDVVHSFDGDRDFRPASFIPFLQPYEFEAFLFVDPCTCAKELAVGDADEALRIEKAMSAVSAQFDTPEHINEGFDTAPSKRIAGIDSGFIKNKAGKAGFSWRIANKIGIERIREKCLHFDKWMSDLEDYATSL